MPLARLMPYCLLLLTQAANAADWSTTELHLQYATFDRAYSNHQTQSTILTFQHASGWQYGDNFFFIDHASHRAKSKLDSDDSTFYGEFYSHLSLKKTTGIDVSFGPLKDIGLVAGFNFAPEVDTLYYLPGVRINLDLPYFAFAKFDITAYIHNSDQQPKQETGYMMDFAWSLPFEIGSAKFSLTGHAEYISDANINGGGYRQPWLLAQPQLRYDLGNNLWNKADQLYVGVEYQMWINKLGDDFTDENTIQALVVWRL
ncbi:hypothetical protein C2869_10470 [Saccharobesus litoralis]|uniref:Nucleoside-specific outer membrane channel protein Tsx n=1 Tax=Saccharobesus litoralis TaxID=2172099 RepID=A0A2S0VRI8_9ALTE|nr:outer membrane protein OmpK [Saccharobesus litoralis]AWB66828.1 hypothetical protein C2869_10470 [Saccharobesus litoralis]